MAKVTISIFSCPSNRHTSEAFQFCTPLRACAWRPRLHPQPTPRLGSPLVPTTHQKRQKGAIPCLTPCLGLRDVTNVRLNASS